MVVPHYLILLNYQDKIIYTIFSFLLLFSILSMEATPEGTQKRPQYSHRKDYLHHHYHHQHYNHEPNHQHHGIQITNPIVLIPIISILLVFAIFLVIFLLCKLKSASNESSKEHSNNKNDRVRKLSTDSTSISFNSSPDVKNRCLYRGSSGQTPTRRSAGIQVFTYKEIEFATNSFSEENVIGIGKLGAVYRGILGDGIVAAIKKLNREGKQGGEREFRIEVDLLSRLHSSYLVELLGYCADQHHRVLVFEFMPNGSLQQHLHPSHKTHNQPLNWGTRLRIALDCARALEFLHENAVPSIIHGDFRCSNIVLDYNFRAKVSDLGLAKIVSDKINGQVSTQVMGTATGYLAPEYTSTGKLSTKSDVYSYGVVLLELITGRIPIDTKQPPGEHVLVSWALPRLTNREKVEEMVDPALKGQFSKKELIQVAAIAAVCVQQEADYRPFMTDVVQSLIPLVKSFSTSCPSNSFRYNSRAVSPRP